MTPASPVLLLETQPFEVVYAKAQPEYLPLPALKGTVESRPVLTRWVPTQEERDAIAAGADIHLTLLTFGHPLQPILLEVLSCHQDKLDKLLQLFPVEPGVCSHGQGG